MRDESDRRARIEASKRQWTAAAPEINSLTNPIFRNTTAAMSNREEGDVEAGSFRQQKGDVEAGSFRQQKGDVEAGTFRQPSTSSASSSSTLKVIRFP
jgi:hypothetical protein